MRLAVVTTFAGITKRGVGFCRRPFSISLGRRHFCHEGEHVSSIEAKSLSSAAAIASASYDIQEIFDKDRLPQPPLPEKVLSLAPCNVLVTETKGD